MLVQVHESRKGDDAALRGEESDVDGDHLLYILLALEQVQHRQGQQQLVVFRLQVQISDLVVHVQLTNLFQVYPKAYDFAVDARG